jgi:hypothetical protein
VCCVLTHLLLLGIQQEPHECVGVGVVWVCVWGNLGQMQNDRCALLHVPLKFVFPRAAAAGRQPQHLLVLV